MEQAGIFLHFCLLTVSSNSSNFYKSDCLETSTHFPLNYNQFLSTYLKTGSLLVPEMPPKTDSGLER